MINAWNMEHGLLFLVRLESRREIMRELDHEAADSVEIRPGYIPNTRLEY